MNRSHLYVPLLALWTALAVVAVTLAMPATAQAQQDTGASLSLHVSEPSADQLFRTVAVALDPGQSGLAALGATLTFAADDVVIDSCAVSEVGACNVAEDQVLLSVFNLAELQANQQLLTVNFQPTSNDVSSTTFTVEATTAVTSQGSAIEDVAGDSVDVELVSPTFGALTGSVVDATTTGGIFGLDVCVISDSTGAQTCTTTTGLGTWRIDDLATGTYAVVIADPTNTYEDAIASGFVIEDEVSVVAESALALFTESTDEDGSDESNGTAPDETDAGEPVADDPAVEVVVPTAPIDIEYGASIQGQVTGLETESPIVAAQVCATQPLVLHQSCATTDANGEFTLSGLSAGNYWVEVVDPLGQFEQIRPTLIGVVGNDVTRTGVAIALPSIAG